MSKKYNVRKYILVSALKITHPYSQVSFILNTLIDDVFHWKIKAENYLKKSGLNYSIIRPGKLEGQKEDSYPEAVTIS